ncbi:Phosphopantothenoylcysteine decarboxylase [Spatholobus suberectus]|nr:Phosphopantothenoylcysteine decarboxylase [Spatholobus suberectus]
MDCFDPTSNKGKSKVKADEARCSHLRKPQILLAACGSVGAVYCDKHEWQIWNGIGDPVLHIELCRWADIMVIAPLSANTLGKIAGGLCDNLLTCIVRA